jgi:hypothetical protein
VSFFRDEKKDRVGMLTTLPVKHAMCTLTNAMLRYIMIQCGFFSPTESGQQTESGVKAGKVGSAAPPTRILCLSGARRLRSRHF